jgi:hypothetical protein
VAGATGAALVNTRLTVERETPAAAATFAVVAVIGAP